MSLSTPNSGDWSEFPRDLLRSIFEKLSFADFRRAKMVCWNWNLVLKLTVPRKSKSPWLMVFPEEEDSCMLYNPEEDRVYRTLRDFSGIRFLASSGNWFLVVDSRSTLYIIDVFSEEKFDLPSLESIQPANCSLKRVGDKRFTSDVCISVRTLATDGLKGVLWVDEKTKEFTVVWYFDGPASFICYCKKGDDHYTNIPPHDSILLQGIYDVILRGHSLYIQNNRDYIRCIDLSRTKVIQDVTWNNPLSRDTPFQYQAGCNITVVTSSEELILVQSILDETTSIERHMGFRVLRMNPDPNRDQYYIEVDSLGDEALLLGLRTTVSGIEPNSIYFTSHDSIIHSLWKNVNLEICVFNLATKTLKRFPSLSNMKLKAARWFLPDTCGI